MFTQPTTAATRTYGLLLSLFQIHSSEVKTSFTAIVDKIQTLDICLQQVLVSLTAQKDLTNECTSQISAHLTDCADGTRATVASEAEATRSIASDISQKQHEKLDNIITILAEQKAAEHDCNGSQNRQVD